MCLFVPCLTFVNLAENFDPATLLQMWFLPVNVLMNNVIGCVVGLAVVRCTASDAVTSRLVLCTIMAGNMGNLPMVILTAVCGEPHSRQLLGDACLERGVAYIVLGMWAAQTVQFTMVNRILAPPGVELDASDEKQPAVEKAGIALAEEDAVEIPPELQPHDAELPCGQIQVERNGSVVQAKSSKWKVLRRRYALALSALSWVKPPVWASWIAVLVSATPPLKRSLFGESAPLGAVTATMTTFGNAFIAGAFLCLGGGLANGPGEGSKILGYRTIACSVAARLVVVPIVGWAFIQLVARTGIFADDPVFMFVCMLQHSTPAAVNLSVMSTLHGHGTEEIAALLFWQYVVALPFLGMSLALNFMALPRLQA